VRGRPARFQAKKLRDPSRGRLDHGYDAVAPPIVTLRPAKSATVVAVRGKIDMPDLPPFQDRLAAQTLRSGPRLIVDLTAVNYLGAAALTALLAVEASGRAAGGHGMSIVASTHALIVPLPVIGLDDFFDVHPDPAHTCAEERG
jgi:anti-sigma B factor antagonist